MSQGKRRAGVVVALAFNIWLAKGHLDWMPDFGPLIVMAGAGIYYLAADEKWREFAGKIVAGPISSIIDPNTDKPVAHRTLSSQRRGLLRNSAVVLASTILLGMGGWWLRSSSDVRHIKVPLVLIGPLQSDGKLSINGANSAIPGSNWAANVYFSTPVKRDVQMCRVFTLLPYSLADRDDREDQEWDKMATCLKYNKGEKYQVVADKDLYMTLDGPVLSQDDLSKLIDGKSALYLMVLLSYRDIFGTHNTEICTLRLGNSPSTGLCHDHNT